MTQVYEVPVVFHGLRQPEAYLQIIDALDNLNNVVEETYTRISGRVSVEKSRIESISGRLGVAQAKVEKITGSTKAITVLSSAKYPTNTSRPDYIPLYGDATKKHPKVSGYHLKDVALPQPVAEETLDASELLFMEQGSASSQLEAVGIMQEGLGRLPHRIPSISSLLLFNSSENPYKKYMKTDNLAGTDAVARAAAAKSLSAAPESMIKGDTLNLPANLDFNYKPPMSAGWELNLPNALPLPNVAEDLSWSGFALPEVSSGIAPSQHLPLPNFDVLPPVASGGAPSSSTPALPNISSSAPPPPAPPSGAAPPPPPPPPSNAPPPPPPGAPPPPPPKATPSNLPAAPPSLQDSDAPSADDGRSGLLAAIRAGKKLKKVEEADEDEKPAKKAAPKAAGASTGDIFGDLIQALNRRRKGIAIEKPKSGKSKKNDDEIKAPPKMADGDSDDDDEDEDSEEWQ